MAAEVTYVPPSMLLGTFVWVRRATLLLVCRCIYVLLGRFGCDSNFVSVVHAPVADG